MVTTRSGGIALGIVQLGDAIPEVRAFDRSRAPEVEFPATGTIVRGSFDSLESDLARVARTSGA